MLEGSIKDYKEGESCGVIIELDESQINKTNKVMGNTASFEDHLVKLFLEGHKDIQRQIKRKEIKI